VLATNQNHIPGIHNYCDRWCERCANTSRCAVFFQEQDLTPAEKDVQNEAFWNRISKNFKDAIQLLHRAAAERGIDLQKALSELDDEEWRKQEALERKDIESHPLIRNCDQYIKLVRPFLDAETWMQDKRAEMIRSVELGINSDHAAIDQIEDLSQHLEVIRWYLFFIQAKFQRALRGKLLEDNVAELESDQNGSAKIALIALQRSQDAWAGLYKIIPEQEDTILDALVALQRIRKIAEQEFPLAYAFRRPGFDQ
jgi:hypothetical protein